MMFFSYSFQTKAKGVFAFLLLVMLTGCASLRGETDIDWFVRVANEPDMANTRFCVSSAPETEDGSNPTQRARANMACGDNLESVKKQTVSTCESVKKTKCMPVYYFERGRDEFVKDFERENMARKAAQARRIQMQAQRAEQERLSRICVGYGFRPQTDAHANCVMKQIQHENQIELQQQSIESQKRLERSARDAANGVQQIKTQRFLECLNRNRPGEICV